MPTVIIDNREIEIPAGRRLNGIEAARLAGIEIPHYCWHPGLSVVGSCRMCLVEVGTRDPKTGKITMQPKLVPACNTLVTDNMVLVTNSEKVARARAMVEEGLLLRHPIDCPICDKAGECLLQDYHFHYGQDERRADLRPFTSRRRDLGDVTLFVDRCVLCSRCVRFAAEISGTNELMVTGRGAHEEIDVVPGFPLEQQALGQRGRSLPGRGAGRQGLSLSAAGVVPAAAPRRLHRLRHRLLDLDRGEPGPHLPDQAAREPVCEQVVDLQRRPLRLSARPRPAPADLPCRRPALQHGAGETRCDRSRPTGRGLPRRTAASELRKAGRLAAVVSPFLTVEEAYLLCKLIRGIDAEALLVLGPVPAVGEDERFPRRFTISRGEVSQPPRRRGGHRPFRPSRDHVRRVAAGTGPAARCRASGSRAATRTIGSTRPTARRFERLKLLVVQDLFPSPLSRAGDLRAARRRLCRARRLVRQPRRPAAIGRPGRSARRRACGPRGVCFGSCSAARGCIIPGRCWTRSPAKSSISPPSSARCRRRGLI